MRDWKKINKQSKVVRKELKKLAKLVESSSLGSMWCTSKPGMGIQSHPFDETGFIFEDLDYLIELTGKEGKLELLKDLKTLGKECLAGWRLMCLKSLKRLVMNWLGGCKLILKRRV